MEKEQCNVQNLAGGQDQPKTGEERKKRKGGENQGTRRSARKERGGR